MTTDERHEPGDATVVLAPDEEPPVANRTPPSAEVVVSDPRRWSVLAVMCLSLLIVGIDGTIVNVALPTLVRELGATVERAAVDRRRVHDRVREPAPHRRQLG